MKKRKPLISVILPIYNVESYIEECLDSILAQTIGHENIEVIMVNDCSTDGTGKIMDDYADKYSNFKAIHLQKNFGSPGTPRNIGIRKARGKYLAFLDPDDLVPEDAYQALFEVCEKYGSDFAMGKLTSFNEETKATFTHVTFRDYMLEKAYYNTNIKESKHFLQVKTAMIVKLIRRDFVIRKKIFFLENIRNGEDKYFDIQLYKEAKKFCYIPKTVYLYRLRTDETNKSLTQQNLLSAVENDVNVCMLLKPLLDQHGYEYFQINTFRSILWRIMDAEFTQLPVQDQVYVMDLIEPVIKGYNKELAIKYVKPEEPFLSLMDKGYKKQALDYCKLLVSRKICLANAQRLEKDYHIQMRIRKDVWWIKLKQIRSFSSQVRKKVKGV